MVSDPSLKSGRNARPALDSAKPATTTSVRATARMGDGALRLKLSTGVYIALSLRESHGSSPRRIALARGKR
jgi:hypothetical protein